MPLADRRKHPKPRREHRGAAARGKLNRKRLPKTATEPALIRAGIVAVLSVLATFGVKWAADVDKVQIEVLAAALPAVVLAAGVLIRFAVTASAKVVARLSVSKDAVVAGPAAAVDTGTVLETFTTAEGRLVQPVPLTPAR